MNTKPIRSEYTASLLMANATKVIASNNGWTIGKNFLTPVAKKPQPKKSFWSFKK